MPFIAQGMVLSRTAEMVLRFNALPPAPNYLFWSSAVKPSFWSVWLERGRAADKKKGSQAFYCLTPPDFYWLVYPLLILMLRVDSALIATFYSEYVLAFRHGIQVDSIKFSYAVF